MGKNTISRTLFVVLVATAWTAILPFAPSIMASPSTYFFVDPPYVDATGQPSGYEFLIDIKVNDAPNAYAWEVIVKWDPNLLSIFLVSEGDFLKRPPTNYPTTFAYYPSNVALASQWGNIAVGCSLYGGLPMNEWASGDGWLCRLGFEVKATGSTVIDLSDTLLLDHMESELPASTPYPNVDGFFSNVVRATVNFSPDTLNLKRNAKWIVAYIQPQEGFDAADIDASTILLNGTIAPILDSRYGFVRNPSAYLVDYNKDGILERLVKFDGAAVKSLIYQSVGMQQEISLTITGQSTDGTPFEGNDTISVF